MKKFIFNGTVGLLLAAVIIAITVMAFTACTKKSETQSQTAEADKGPYPQILNGDLTAFAGTWVDGYGTRSQLRADGVFTSGSMGNLMADGFSMYDYGAYVWNVMDTGGYGGFGVMVYPPGVQINLFYMDGGVRKIAETIETDTTKVRITAGQDGPSSSAEVYYRESEAPRAAASSGGLNFSVTYIQHADMNHLANRKIIRHGEGYEKIIISADADIYEFKIYSLGMVYDEFLFFAEDIVYSLDTLQASSAIEYTTLVSEGIPAEAISFKTADGAMYSYTLGVSGMDGTVILSPWKISYAQTQQTDLIGQWRFESGGNVNFFGHEFVTIGTDDFMEIWGIRPGESYMSGGSYTKETASWKISGRGELAVYHESGVNGVFSFSITIKDDVMNITDQNGNSAVFKKVYLQ